jgi:hypothetical protein
VAIKLLTKEEAAIAQKEYGNETPNNNQNYLSPSVKDKSIPLSEEELELIKSETLLDEAPKPSKLPFTITLGDKLKNSYASTQDLTPAEVAEGMKIGKYIGLPAEYFIGNEEAQKLAKEAAQKKQENEIDWDGMAERFPNLANYLSNPLKMASAKDVIEELGELEQTFKKHSSGVSGSWEKPGLIQRAGKVVGDIFKGLGMAIPAGMGETVASGAKLAELGSELMGGDKWLRPWWEKYIPDSAYEPLRPVFEKGSEILKKVIPLPKSFNEPLPENMRDIENVGFSDLLYQGMAPLEEEAGKLSKPGRFTYRIAKPIPNIVLSGTAGAALATGLKSAAAQGVIQMTPFVLSAAGSYAKEAELDGASPLQQAAYGTVMGIMEGLTEKIPFDTWFKIGGKVGIKNWIKSMTVEGLQELIIDPIANITKKFMDIAPDMEWVGEGGVFDVKQMGESFVGGVGTGALMAGGSSIANRVLSRMMNNYDESMTRVDQAKNDSEVYKQIGEMAANSQYLERLPEGFRELVEANTKDGKLENIYIDTENLMTFFQEANPDIPAEQSLQIVAEELGIREQLQEAIDTNKPLRIPYAVWLEKVVKTPLYKQMEQHIKFSEEGLTLFQAREEEKRVGEMIAEEQKRAEKYIKSNESLQIGYDTVYNDIKEKLIAAGRPKVEAEAGARLWASRAVAESVRRNINPIEWYMGQNKPDIVKVDFMPSEISEDVKATLSPQEREFIDILAEQNQPIEAIEADIRKEYERILQDQVNYLNETKTKGVQQGSLVIDEVTGKVVDRVGRQSKNLKWYRDFYAEKGRAPSQKEIRELALKQLREGYLDDTAEIPANLDFISLENTLEGIRNLKEKISGRTVAQSYNQANDLLKGEGGLNGKALYVNGKLVYPKDILKTAHRYMGSFDYDAAEGGYEDAGHDAFYTGRAMLEGDEGAIAEPYDEPGVHITKKNDAFFLRYDSDDFLKNNYGLTKEKAFDKFFDAATALYRDGHRGKLYISELDYVGTIEEFTGNAAAQEGTFSQAANIEGMENTEEFKKWFKGSKVVDEQGKPLITYHATNEDFNEFDFNRLGEFTSRNTNEKEPAVMAGLGAWTNTQPLAEKTVQKYNKKVYMSIKNPLEITFDDLWDLAKNYNSGKELRSALLDDGYDGLKVDDSEFGETSYVAFSSDQIKIIPEDSGSKKKSAQMNLGEDQGSSFYQTDSKAFKKWFGDSKVVDEQGKPLVVYHGTLKPGFTEFNPSTIGDTFGADERGFFFISDPKIASTYAETNSYGASREGGGVYPAYISLKKPLILDDLFLKKEGMAPIGKNNEDVISFWDNYQSLILEWADDKKADGVILVDNTGKKPVKMIVAFKPNQIKSIYNQGTFDPNDPNILMQDINAQVNINKESSVITLFKTANASSFLHESAHLFLNDTFEFVKSGQADEEYLNYWGKIAKHLDVKEDQETLTTEQQEKFAREFEAYLREGKAPSEGLRKAFSAFRRWLTRIYRDITGLGVEVTDEVREIMDRMLATEEEIREREVYNGYDKDLIKESDVSPATWKKLQDLKEKAHEMAIEQLMKPQMDELKPEYGEWLEQERENVRKIVQEEVGKLPIFQVMEAVRMSFGQVKDVKDIARRYINKAEGITNEGIAKFEAIADAYGYTSGDHLAQKIVNAPLFVDEVNYRVETHMAQYADLRERADIKYEAEKAVRNDGRLDLMSLERAILLDLIKKEELSQAVRQRALERARIHTAAAKRYAKAILADKPYREAQAATSYFAAERNAAVKEAGYYNAKDYEKAAKYAEQRILNHALATEALKVKGEVEKSFKYLDKWQKQKRPDKIGQDHLNQIDKILNRFGLRELTQNAIEDTTTLNDWIKAHTAEDYDEAAIPPDIANEAFAKNYKNLTLGELRDLVSAIKNIEMVARNENRLLTDDQKREFQAVVDSVVASIKSKNKVNFPKSYDPNQTAIDKAAHYLRGFVAAHKKVEYIVRALDGYKDQGPLWDLIIKPMMRGMDKEYKLRAEMGNKLEKIYRKHYGKETHKLAETKVHVEEVAHLFPKGLTKENVLAMALNWGTESNRIRLIDAYNESIELNGEDVKEIVQMYRSRLKPSEQGDVSNYDIILQYKRDQIKAGVQAAFDQVMTEADWRFVQSVWDFIGSYWPQIAADKKVRTGVEPVKLPTATVETRYGAFEGGYYPVSYDPRMSEKASRQQEENSLKELFNLSFMKPSTRRSFEKERVDKVFNRPLDLHLSVIDKHLSDVAHSVSFTNAIRDADKLLNNQQIQRAIKEAVGDETYKQFRPWLQGIAREGRDTATVGPWAAVEKILSRARIGSSIVNMGFKMTTAFSQIAGIVPVMDKIGARRTAAGVMEFYKKMITGKAKEDIDFVFSKSEMMKNRMQNRDRDIKDATRKLLAKNQLDEVKDSYFSLTGLFDLAVCMPTWIASYNKSIEEQVKSGKGEVNEETAIRYADLVVRETQGSGDIVNMAAVQRGTEIQKLLTQFYSYFSVYANRQIEAFDRAKRNGEYSQLVSFAMYWWFFPAVVSELLAGRGPDDDDEQAGWWASTLLRYPFDGFIILRDLANSIGPGGFGFELSPSAEAFAKTVQFLNLLPKTISGDAEPGKLLKTGFEAGGYWLQYPSKQISTTVGNIYEAMVEGEDFYLRDLFFPKPKSRR